MQTKFTKAQLADPEIDSANTILRACVHCGLCTSSCPTYRILGDELDSPRGRIYLMKQMFEQDRPASSTDVRHIDRCLSCLSCMTACPAGVNYMHLVDQARAHIEETFRRPFHQRVLRELFGRVLPDPKLFSYAVTLSRIVAPVMRNLPGILGRLVTLSSNDSTTKVLSPFSKPGVFLAEGTRKHRVALLAGCVQQVITPQITVATIRTLTRHGCEVVVPRGAGCCGALNHHLGQEARARDAAAANLHIWQKEILKDGLDAVIVNASGCGTMVKDYGHLFRNDAELAEPANQLSAITKDISEFLADIGIEPRDTEKFFRVVYQSACSLQHGQGILHQPLELLRQCGFEVVQPENPHLCCGSAGTYNLLQADIADHLRADKISSLIKTNPQIIASGNVGCMVQLSPVAPCPVLHTVELLDWATGGPLPHSLEGIAA